MQRLGMVLGLLGVCAGCGSRAASTSDSTLLSDLSLRPDQSVRRDSRAPDWEVPASCTSLNVIGQVSLDFADTTKFGPRIAFDGDRFAVVWHSQPGIISSMSGELRFAQVDSTGKTSTPDGIKLGTDNGIIPASLETAGGEYAVLHMPILTTGAEQGVELRRIDAKGQTLGSAFIKGQFYQAAMTAHPSGYALLLAVQSGSPELMVVDGAGSVLGSPLGLISAQVMASLWLAPRPGGFAAALHSTNSNATLYVLDPSCTIVKQTGVGHSGIKSPSFAVLPTGFAAVYGTAAHQLEAELYDAAGTPLGQHELTTAITDVTATEDTALTWTGKQLVATYPGAVSGQYRLQLLDASGDPTGQPVPLPNCLMTAHGVSAVWGKNVLAVAAINEASGVMKSSVCVTLMGCL